MAEEMGFPFTEVLELLLKGKLPDAVRMLTDGIMQEWMAELDGMKHLLLMLLLIGVLSAACMLLMQTFQNKQIADVAHFISYLLLLTIVLSVFVQAAEDTQVLVERLVSLVKVFVPVFMLALGLASGTLTAVGYYQILLLGLFLVQSLLLRAGIPLTRIFLMLHVMNGIWEEDRLSGLTQLLQKGLTGVMKFILAGAAGLGMLQSMVTPVMERLQAGAAGKMISAIPGIGDLAEGTTQLLIGSAVLVKNGLGAAAILLLTALCILPVLRIAVWAGVLKLSAALMGLTADKRLTVCMNGAGDALLLLLRIIFTVLACFLIIFAIITSLTGVV